ncbi:MAG: hypothetical protein RL693_1365 [Verrucomicrobiota bacterium]|jgi:cytochrome oxidase Cu insertion factor (SCO1/SenC/PrrC family)
MESVLPPVDAPRTHVLFWTVVVLFAGLVVLTSSWLHYSLRKLSSGEEKSPAIFHRITGDLEATERSGKTVRMSELKGKVYVCAYVYTVCPHGCAAVIGEMMKLEEKFGDRPDFQLVSLAVLPKQDTPEFFRSYADGLQLKPTDPWWFLSGDQQKIWDFMTNDLKFAPAIEIPEEERINPLDLYQHDLRIALVDRTGRVRGYYTVFHPQPEIASLMCEKLQIDVGLVLDEVSEPQITPPK